MKRMFDDLRVSYINIDDDQKDPLPFQQLMDMPTLGLFFRWGRRLEALDRCCHWGGKEPQMTTPRFLMTTHFLACCVAITSSLESLSSTT
jgi:hypothetical protein